MSSQNVATVKGSCVHLNLLLISHCTWLDHLVSGHLIITLFVFTTPSFSLKLAIMKYLQISYTKDTLSLFLSSRYYRIRISGSFSILPSNSFSTFLHSTCALSVYLVFSFRWWFTFLQTYALLFSSWNFVRHYFPTLVWFFH